MHSPVSLPHARLVRFLEELLNRWLRLNGVGGELFQEVVAVHLGRRSVFLPDLCWFSAEQVPYLLKTHAPFAPRWVCEVLSPRTADRDRGPKFAAYEEHGVQEYWLLDPDRREHSFFRTDGVYLQAFGQEESCVHSAVLEGFWVRREWLDAENLPDVETCLVELERAKAGDPGR